MRPREADTHDEVSPSSPPPHTKVRATVDPVEEEVDAVSLTEKLRSINSNNTSGDLDCCEVRKSTIPGAGLGLFATKTIYPNQRITKYSGRVISLAEARASKSSYLLYINKSVCLDAEGRGHMVGRYTNEGEISGKVNNARFGAQQVYYKCKKTGRAWSPIIAQRKILQGEEIFAPYGPEVRWSNLPSVHNVESNDDDEELEKNGDGKDGDHGAEEDGKDREGKEDPEEPESESDDDDARDEDWTPSQVQTETSPKAKKPLVHEVIDNEWFSLKYASTRNDEQVNEPEDHKAVAAKWYDDLCESIKAVADKILPKSKSKKAPERHTSERTKKLMKRRARMNRRNSSRAQFRRMQKRIKESCLQDYVEWVDSCVGEMEQANEFGDVRRIYHLVNKLSQKPKPPPVNLTKDEQGNPIQSPQAVVEVWERFLKGKFQAAEPEASRPPLEPLPEARSEEDNLQRAM